MVATLLCMECSSSSVHRHQLSPLMHASTLQCPFCHRQSDALVHHVISRGNLMHPRIDVLGCGNLMHPRINIYCRRPHHDNDNIIRSEFFVDADGDECICIATGEFLILMASANRMHLRISVDRRRRSTIILPKCTWAKSMGLQLLFNTQTWLSIYCSQVELCSIQHCHFAQCSLCFFSMWITIVCSSVKFMLPVTNRHTRRVSTCSTRVRIVLLADCVIPMTTILSYPRRAHDLIITKSPCHNERIASIPVYCTRTLDVVALWCTVRCLERAPCQHCILIMRSFIASDASQRCEYAWIIRLVLVAAGNRSLFATEKWCDRHPFQL